MLLVFSSDGLNQNSLQRVLVRWPTNMLQENIGWLCNRFIWSNIRNANGIPL